MLLLLAGKGISAMVHPPYSLDLAPADLRLFPKLKSLLKGKHFLDIEDIKSSVKKNVDRHFCSGFKNCFEQWPKCWEHCKELEGEYSDMF
jgi:hypothetical protein